MYGKQDDPARSSASIEEWRDWAQHCGMPGLRDLLGELRAAREELAELRALAAGSYSVGWTWRDGELTPDDYVLTDEDGDPVDLAVDGSGLVRAALERQAATWVRAAELTPAAVPLEQLLSLVPAGVRLSAGAAPPGVDYGGQHRAMCGGADVYRRGLVPALREAVLAYLRGRQRCGTCAHWGSPGEEGGDRECQATEPHLRKTAASSCPDSWAPGQWLSDEPGQLSGSPARLVRAALAWADEIGRLGNLHYTAIERELFAAANELRGTEQ